MERKIQQTHVSVVEAYHRTDISTWSWRRMAYDGRIASTKIGSRLLIPITEIDRVMEEGTRPRLVSTVKLA